MDPQIKKLAETIWNYHRLNHALVKSDAIMVLCSHDELVARRGAELFLSGWSPLLIFAGGLGANFNHAKFAVSISGNKPYAIFGDMNQQCTLSGNCKSRAAMPWRWFAPRSRC